MPRSCFIRFAIRRGGFAAYRLSDIELIRFDRSVFNSKTTEVWVNKEMVTSVDPDDLESYTKEIERQMTACGAIYKP